MSAPERIAGTSGMIKAWNSVLQEDSLTRDPLVNFTGTYSDKAQTIPDAVIMNVEKQVAPGVNDVTITVLKALSERGVYGRKSLSTNEEGTERRNVTLHAHNVKHGIPTDQNGLDAWHNAGVDLLGRIQPLLSQWLDETRGEHYRHAAIEMISPNLEEAPVSLTKGLNPNIYVTGVGPVTYDSTLATYVTAIDTAVPNSPTTANQVSVTSLNDMIEYLTATKAVAPIMVNGRPSYVVLVPSNQAKLFRNPGSATQLAGLYVDADVRGADNKAISGYLGTYGPLILIEDARAPRLTINTTISVAYKGPGETDDRPAPGTTIWDAIIVLGKGALGFLELEKPNFRDENQDYKTVKGIGVFTTYGIQLMAYDKDSKTDTSVHQKSSAIFLAASKTA